MKRLYSYWDAVKLFRLYDEARENGEEQASKVLRELIDGWGLWRLYRVYEEKRKKNDESA